MCLLESSGFCHRTKNYRSLLQKSPIKETIFCKTYRQNLLCVFCVRLSLLVCDLPLPKSTFRDVRVRILGVLQGGKCSASPRDCRLFSANEHCNQSLICKRAHKIRIFSKRNPLFPKEFQTTQLPSTETFENLKQFSKIDMTIMPKETP